MCTPLIAISVGSTYWRWVSNKARLTEIIVIKLSATGNRAVHANMFAFTPFVALPSHYIRRLAAGNAPEPVECLTVVANARKERVKARIASASRDELQELKRRAVAVLERVQSASKYRLRSKIEDIEAAVAIETLAQVEAALKRRGRLFIARHRLLLKIKYLKV